MRVALICNTVSAFPLLDWLSSQGLLAGVGVKKQKSDFFSDLSVVCSQRRITPQVFEKEQLTSQLSNWVQAIRADIVLVLGFPYKIPKKVLAAPRLGIYNIHFGKLPKYSGSFPVFWQIKNQEKEGVLTIHKMDENFDSGPIAFEIPFEIKSIHTYGIVEANYSYVTINAVFMLLDNILKGTLNLKNQSKQVQKLLPKPTIKDLIIDWKTMNAHQIVALIKACNPWNRGAIARINGVDVKIIEAEANPSEIGKPAQVFNLHQNGMEVACINQTALNIKIMYSSFGYLCGESLTTFGIKNGDVFENIVI
ncbi:MAG: hypothetical protein MUF45_03525 [Spirosomaceae bacterium]|nr:hypothetical protein [Spirosomataceae bacterium]